MAKLRMSGNLLSDEELMTQLQEGSRAALEELYLRHASKVWTYVSKRVGREAAEDLYQDCFIKLVEKKDSWKGQPFILWLYVVLRNLVIDYFRGQARSKKLLLSSPEAESGSAVNIDLKELLEGSSPETKKLLGDFFMKGYTYKELALEYEASEISLRKKVSRALAFLKNGV